MKITLLEDQWNVFKVLQNVNTSLSVQDIAAKAQVDHPKTSATLQYGQEQNWVSIEEQPKAELIPSEELEKILTNGLPERQALTILKTDGRIAMKDLAEKAKELDIPVHEVIKWGTMRGWFEKNKGELVLTETGSNAISQKDDDEKALEHALTAGAFYLDELVSQGIDIDKVQKYLANRNNVAKVKQRTIRYAQLTDEGKNILSGDSIKIVKERNILSSDDITSGEWKNVTLRQYDVTLASEKIAPAKIHPMQKIIQQTRHAFLEMGFTEIVSPQVESAFWDFDALFQPQDHPARDMQDTFYLQRPNSAKLPDDKIVEHVKQTHEDGWETGSTGWGYKWDVQRSRQTVLRTHTTASTIRALSQNPNPPRKVFCVGKVYRNEAISYKHLPEFFQVDGVIIDEKANLATLLGTIKEFYRKMGFDKVRFKPDFFPYTEPSAEITVFMESKQNWIELGGSGIYRPEVTRPMGCNVPVLAWGLGLDRLAMLRYGINDIRELYWSDLDRIKEVPLCQ